MEMNKEEATQIATEIEENEELETEELSCDELTELESEEDGNFEDDEDEDDAEGIAPVAVTENYTIVKQPISTSVEVGCEVGAKGEVKPFATLKITRNLEEDSDVDLLDIVAEDFEALADLVETEINSLKNKMNKGRPEMQ